jgi:predicted acetyltransferase
MEIRVVAAKKSDQLALGSLFQLYSYDFSEILPLHVDDGTGRFEEGSLDAYWIDAWRFPFLLRAAGHLAGFALVHSKSRLSDADDVWDMAEFFVLRGYRRTGLGTAAAHQIFAAHEGPWEVRQRTENVAATAFWRKLIGGYAGSDLTEEWFDDERWRGPVQRFRSPPRPAGKP